MSWYEKNNSCANWKQEFAKIQEFMCSRKICEKQKLFERDKNIKNWVKIE